MKLSGYYPSRKTISELIRKTADQVQLSMQQQNIAVRHNAYTDYCLALLFCCTGHRPIHDPIQSQKYFDLEQGWMLIADKVVTEERAWRVVALPKMACLQLKYYADYLPKLTGCLAELGSGKDTVMELNGLISGKDTQPYFFYLDESEPTKRHSITPKLMLKRWSDRWQLPLNFLRHIAATELLHSSGRADWVQIQLGHITGVDHPFGTKATESVKDVLSKISPHLDAFMDGLGWQPLRSAMRNPSGELRSKYGEKDEKNSSSQFSHDERAQRREDRRQRAAPVVKAAITKVLGDNKRLPTPLEFNEINKEIVEQAYEKRLNINHCVRLLERYIQALPGGTDLLRCVTRIRALEHEPSPFNESSLCDYKTTKKARQNFLKYLDETGKLNKPLNKEQRIAEIITSAALFDGMVDPAKLDRLSAALINNTYQYNGELFVDIPLTDKTSSPVFRWFPSLISSALILGFYQSLDTVKPCDAEQLVQHLNSISLSLGLKASKVGLANLIHVATAGVIFEIPGHIGSCLLGNTATVSLSLPQWLRFQSNKALQIQANSPIAIGNDSTTWLSGTDLSKATNTVDETREFLKTLRTLFTQSKELPAEKNIKRSRVQKKALTKAIKKTFAIRENTHWSSQLLAIVSWSVHLCEQGTRSKKDLAFSTVDQYTFMVARALSSISLAENFLALDDSGYEELYIRAIENIPETRRFNLAGRFVEFHTFLVNTFAVDKPAWSAVFRSADMNSEINYANANIISENEYIRILKSIQNDQSIDALLRSQYTVLLILGYRFGLRIGEALRLQYRDVQIEKPTVCILIRNSIFGDTKSAAGVRSVPLLEMMTDNEFDVLDRLMSYSEASFDTDIQTPLMSAKLGSRELINRYSTIQDLSRHIRLITGDTSLRFHHLRHSWATRMYAHLSKQKNPMSNEKNSMTSSSVIDEHWQEFIGLNECNYPLRSIATAIGHQSETTTIEYYVHCIDKASQGLINTDEYAVSNRAYAYALNIDVNTVKQRVARQRLCIIHNKIPTPNIKFAKNSDLMRVGTQQMAHEKLKLFEIDLLLRRFSETKQDIEKLASQLLLDSAEAKKLLHVAAHMERVSGFEYYQADWASRDKLIGAAHDHSPKIKYFKTENENVSNLLELIDTQLSHLNPKQLKVLESGLDIWRKTLNVDRGMNIIADKSELISLTDGLQVLSLKFGFTQIAPDRFQQQLAGCINTVKRQSDIPLALEKIKSRQENRIGLSIKLEPLIKTKQALNRILIILSIYMDMERL